MKNKIFMLCLGLVLFAGKSHAQWAVIDPTNLLQNTFTAVETGSTAANMIKNFKETVKIFEQGKAYYDALKSVHNLVKDAQKVKETILMIGEISEIYVEGFQRMMNDPNFTVDELAAIAEGYAILLTESSHVLNELKEVVNINGLSLTDKDRMDVVHRAYREVYRYRNLVKYYTNKNIGVSYLRAKQKNETDRILSLYGNPNDRYW